MSNKYDVSVFERIVAGLSYLTVGFFGLIFYIVAVLMKKHLSYFLRYNILQSIFLSFLYFTCSLIIGFICNILLAIPIINALTSWVILLFNRPIIGSYSIIQFCVTAIVIYLVIFALRGKYPRIYWVSNIVEHSVK